MIITLEPVFQTNANKTGLQTFTRIRSGKTPNGNNVYIYKRTTEDNTIYGFEVVVPHTKKAGTYPLPGGKDITYPEDFEEYPGAAQFGRRAWSCINEVRANRRFEELTQSSGTDTDTEPAPDPVESAKVPVQLETPTKRGRTKKTPKTISIPNGEFSMQQIADLNQMPKPNVYIAVQEFISKGQVKEIRRVSYGKGRPTVIYGKINA